MLDQTTNMSNHPNLSMINRLRKMVDVIDLNKMTTILEISLTEQLKKTEVADPKMAQLQMEFSTKDPEYVANTVSKYRKAIYVAFKLITEHRHSIKSMADIRFIIKKYLAESSRKTVLNRFRQKKQVTRINNKFSLVSGLIFSMINQDSQLKMKDVKFSQTNNLIIQKMLNDNENEENLKKQMEINANIVQANENETQVQLQMKQIKASKLKNQVRGIIKSKSKLKQLQVQMTLKHCTAKDSLIPLANLTNPEIVSKEYSSNLMSAAQVSNARMSSIKQKTMLDLKEHLGIRTVGFNLNQLKSSVLTNQMNNTVSKQTKRTY